MLSFPKGRKWYQSKVSVQQIQRLARKYVVCDNRCLKHVKRLVTIVFLTVELDQIINKIWSSQCSTVSIQNKQKPTLPLTL